jgi:hypothetical protein
LVGAADDDEQVAVAEMVSADRDPPVVAGDPQPVPGPPLAAADGKQRIALDIANFDGVGPSAGVELIDIVVAAGEKEHVGTVRRQPLVLAEHLPVRVGVRVDRVHSFVRDVAGDAGRVTGTHLQRRVPLPRFVEAVDRAQ